MKRTELMNELKDIKSMAYEVCARIDVLVGELDEIVSTQDMPMNIDMNMPLSNLNIPGRMLSALESLGVTTLGELADMSREELMSMKNVGVGSIRMAEEILQRLNIKLK